MRYLALDLDDRAVCLARDGRVLTLAPSAVFDSPDGGIAGVNAWRELRSHPRAISTRHLGAVVTQRGSTVRSEALLEAELKARLVEEPLVEGERMWIISPARAEVGGLTALLGITRRMGLPVDGFVDSAAATAAALGSEKTTVVFALGLHHAVATAVDREGAQVRCRRAVETERGGLIELYQVWLDLVSTTMVRRTRFDPLHDAPTEQQVFAAIPALALDAARTGSAIARVTKGSERFEVTLTRDQFSQAAQPIYRAMAGLLHQLRPAGTPIAIVVPRLVAELPGLREQLDQFVDCELISVADGFTAAATSLLDLPGPQADAEAVRLLRRLPVGAVQAVATEGPAEADRAHDATPEVQGVTRILLGQQRAGAPAPSHILWDGRAYSLNADALVVGRGAPESSRHITLPDGLAGVSRRHCTFLHDGNEPVLLDHSTFGTFVNGERVHERVRIHAGDRVRLGEPGVELTLIAVGEVAAATRQT